MKWIDDKSFATRQLWCDASSAVTGNGTEESPFTYEQLRNYFNPDIGIACETEPADGDLINIKNTINLTSNNVVFNIKRTVDGTIYLCSWDVVNLGVWKIETASLSNLEIILFNNEDGYYITNIEARDFVLCQNNGSNAVIKFVDFINSESYPVTINLKNFLVSAMGTINFEQSLYTTLNCYGYSLICDTADLGHDVGDLNLYSGVIKANHLVDGTEIIADFEYEVIATDAEFAWTLETDLPPYDHDYIPLASNIIQGEFDGDLYPVVWIFHDQSIGATSWEWKIGSTIFSTDQNPQIGPDMTAYMGEVITIEDIDYFPVTLTIDGGEKTKTYNAEISYIVDFSWDVIDLTTTTRAT